MKIPHYLLNISFSFNNSPSFTIASTPPPFISIPTDRSNIEFQPPAVRRHNITYFCAPSCLCFIISLLHMIYAGFNFVEVFDSYTMFRFDPFHFLFSGSCLTLTGGRRRGSAMDGSAVGKLMEFECLFFSLSFRKIVKLSTILTMCNRLQFHSF